MRVLVYKRTHTGDPDGATGTFGIHGCMKGVRGWQYDAVVGVGGIGREAKKNKIAGKITWVGIGPHRRTIPRKRGPEVQFDHFILRDADGPEVCSFAPKVAKRIYERGIRTIILDTNDPDYAEVQKVLALAENAPPSPGLRVARAVYESTPPRSRRRGC